MGGAVRNRLAHLRFGQKNREEIPMTGPHRICGSNETTSIIRPQPSESLTIGKLVYRGRCRRDPRWGKNARSRW
ncbi:hypothetical protein ASF91_16080 [Rhizobium sp. Leaf155]|nr:hypothetical protein ASF91_16080 [Rhizobium sp. Leaf155]